MLRYFIGMKIASIGARLWRFGGWTGDEHYKDLNVAGKIGFRLYCLALTIMGVTADEILAETE